MVRIIDTYDGIGVECDCGKTTYVYGWAENEVVDCSNDDCSREFSFNVDAEDGVEADSGVETFGDMPA
jgi:hypothetical protein